MESMRRSNRIAAAEHGLGTNVEGVRTNPREDGPHGSDLRHEDAATMNRNQEQGAKNTPRLGENDHQGRRQASGPASSGGQATRSSWNALSERERVRKDIDARLFNLEDDMSAA